MADRRQIGDLRSCYCHFRGDFEREQILRALAQSPTLGQAAAALGINVTTLWRKRRHYGIG